MKTYKEWLDELTARTDIVRLISRYLPLTKKGASYWGCCPFHHEKTPSFTVNSEKQVYHCFGCKAGGNAISFIKEIESVDFAEAIRILAKECGMEPPPVTEGKKSDDAAIAKKRERLYLLMRDAARHYHENLKHESARKANEYLQRRQLDERMIRRFGLGYSIDGNEIIKYLSSLNYTLEEMKEAGIAAQRADNYYDVFYNRLIFPIINNMNEVVAFGGRTLEQNADFAKYRNSSQTLIFDKSRTIYAVNLLKKRKQKAKIDYIIMTEGYMDVIALHKAGFDTAVASMGTALTYNQAKQLKNFCDRIYISYDGDGAGQKATVRGLDILAESGLNVKVVELPEGLDPDDVIKKHGKDFYNNLLRESLTLPAFKIKSLLKNYDLKIIDQKSAFAVEAMKVIKALENPVEKEEYLKLIHNYTGYSMEVLLKQAEILPANSTENNLSAEKEVKQNNSMDKAEEFVLASLINACDYVDFNEDLFYELSSEFAREVYTFAVERFRKNEGGGAAQLYNRLDESYHKLLDKLINYDFMAGDNREKYFSCTRALKVSMLIKEKERLAEEYKATKDLELVKSIQAIEFKLRAAKDGNDD